VATIRDPRHQRLLSRAFKVQQGYVSPELEPSVQPVVLVEDLAGQDVWSDAPYARRFAKGISGTGDATHPAQAWLTNPPTSGVIVICRQLVVVETGGTSSCDVGFVTGPPGAQNSFRGVALNQRAAGGSAATVNATGLVGPAAFDAPGTMLFLSTGTAEMYQFAGGGRGLDIVLSPGGAVLFVGGNDLAGQLKCSFVWDEVQQQP
jgi:hypothetical protein